MTRRGARGAKAAARRVVGRIRRRRTPRRGNLPIDSALLDDFFARHAHLVTGTVLEVEGASFTTHFGHDVSSLDVVDDDPRNAEATIVADLSEPASLPERAFDCVIAPQVLRYVTDPSAAIANLWQAVRPRGALLVTLPAVAPPDPERGDVDRWRVTEAGLRTLLERGCPDADIDVEGEGHAPVVCGTARRPAGAT